MAGNTEYKNKWQQENRERINLAVKNGYKAKVKEFADKAGESLNGYIVKAIDERMEREK
jgi:predicted HicB family RNase H-like nuclease